VATVIILIINSKFSLDDRDRIPTIQIRDRRTPRQDNGEVQEKQEGSGPGQAVILASRVVGAGYSLFPVAVRPGRGEGGGRDSIRIKTTTKERSKIRERKYTEKMDGKKE
jgi:hypothetical protein